MVWATAGQNWVSRKACEISSRWSYADMANYEKLDQTFSTMVQPYNFFNDIVVVVVELDIFKSWEANICPFKHLETSCTEQKSPAVTMHYLSKKHNSVQEDSSPFSFGASACNNTV